MSTALEYALNCAARGWAVYPVAGNKTPRTPNGHKAASVEPERIRSMATQFGFVLVGVATGEISDLAVLDIDKQHNGIEWWLQNRHRLPTTRTHRTRSGGLHLWFRHHPGLRCSTAKIAPGIDVRAEGGSIIFWPATGLEVLCNGPLAQWPVWLMPAPKPHAAPSYEAHGPRPAAHIEAQLAGLVRSVAMAPEGQRNASLFWATSRVTEVIRRGELSKPHATAALIEAAARAGLDQIEAARTITSAMNGRAG